MTRDKIWRQTFFFQHPVSCNRDRQNCRLGMGGLLQVVFGAFAAHMKQRKTHRFIGFVEHSLRHGIGGGQLFTHAGILRSLSGKNECHFAHVYSCPNAKRGRTGRSGCTAAAESSCSILSFICARARPAATRIAFLTALALERPCPMTQTPRTPRSGAPPYSV